MIIIIKNQKTEVRYIGGTSEYFDTNTIIGDFISGTAHSNYLSNFEEGILIAEEYLKIFNTTTNISLLDYECFRWEHQISNGFDHPENNGVYVGAGAVYEYDTNDLAEFMMAHFHYYLFEKYKIVRCAHCGKWFATKSLKNKYCNRISPCFGSIITGKEELSCYDAVQNIRQKCARIRKNIRDNTTKTASFERRENTFLLAFEKDSEKYFEPGSQTAKPDSQNLLDYYNFLKTTHKNREWLK